MKSILTTITTASLFLVIAGIVPNVAWAANPQFNQLSSFLGDNTFAVNFKLTGLGNASEVDVTLTADATWTCTASGRSGQVTQAHQTLTTTTTFSVGPKPGTSSGTVQLVATCPGNQKESNLSITNAVISAVTDLGESTGPVPVS